MEQNSLNLEASKIGIEDTELSEGTVLVAITASREEGDIVYRVECASELTNEELEYYLSEMIKGICSWKKGICEDDIRSFEGKIKKKKK